MTRNSAFGVGFGIKELVASRVVDDRRALRGARLNLVIPAISRKWAFGGIPTALRLFDRLSTEFEYARIVVGFESESQFDFREWPEWVADHGEAAPRSIAFLGDQSTPLRVSATDFFMATFWSTAVYSAQVIAHQARLFPEASRRFVYLIQDYEPGFYPWSARYTYVMSTYRNSDGAIAVFNSRLLADYFRERGLQFTEQYAFEPMLHPRLKQKRAEMAERGRSRLILVYGRPSIPRNDFDLVIDALRIWASTFPSANEWSVVSVGEPHEDIPLGEKVTLQSQGKLTLDEYADHLSRCWVGLSLMFSPHPSYPPLEMAEFGAWVITNRFENKDLARLAPNIISAEPIAEALAERLAWCCEQYQPGMATAIGNPIPVFSSDGDEFPFASALVRSWRARLNP